jgi:hypothetical protein
MRVTTPTAAIEDSAADATRKRLLTALEDCCARAGMGDFHQAAIRFAEFRRRFAPPQAAALSDRAGLALARSDADGVVSACQRLSAMVEQHFRVSGANSDRSRDGEAERGELIRVLRMLGGY